MAARTGEKLVFDEVGVEVIVTMGGDGEVTTAPAAAEPLKVGKRYQCEATGVQVLVTKPGPAQLVCAGSEMILQEPKKTKAAD